MNRNRLICSGLIVTLILVASSSLTMRRTRGDDQPNIVLVMADDQGWGETGYNSHPILRTPHLDAMAENSLRFDRFYAGCPVCSPTRAAVLTGRTNNRTGVQSHGYALRLQEKTLAQALQARGYATGHFGKWHLNGIRGPGIPILANDSHRPEVFGFDAWLSVTNFFDRDPILSRKGEFEEYEGDSSEIVVEQALEFIQDQAEAGKPSFTVIWFGTPHSPFRAAEADMEPFGELDEESRKHYGELVAMDRALGTLREKLRQMEIAEDTLLWFCSDNGGLPKIKPTTVKNLRGFKGSLYEGGLRVPCLIEWPRRIQARVTSYPAMVVDIAATIADAVDLPDTSFLQPQDGVSLMPLFEQELGSREKPIPFNYAGQSALVDNQWKLLQLKANKKNQRSKQDPINEPFRYELYNLEDDPEESVNLFDREPDVADQMVSKMRVFLSSLDASVQGLDYPEKRVDSNQPVPTQWTELEIYAPYFDQWKDRPEYQSRLKKRERSR